jgi:hypothetical protein
VHALMPASAREWCEFLSAICALVAAGLWFAAALHPITLPGPSGMLGKDWQKSLERANMQAGRILRGAMLNACAACAAGFAALFQFILWLVERPS